MGGTPIPAALPLLDNGYLTVMNALVYEVLRELLATASFDRVEDCPWPAAVIQKGHLRGHVQLRPPAVDACPLMPAEEVERWSGVMWRQQQELSDLDADVLDLLSAIWLYNAKTPQDAILVGVDQLLTLRGLKPKLNGQRWRGGYEPEQRATIPKALSHIQSLWLNVVQIQAYGLDDIKRQRRKPIPPAMAGRAFVITDLKGKVPADGGIDRRQLVFRVGEVFIPFLADHGRQTALLPAKVLEYDPYRQTWTKRLGRYLSWRWRVQADVRPL
jgi:hypothetical protein